MELAHKLVREMDSHRTISVSRTYVPNEYAIWLSPGDRERYDGIETEVIEELCAYLLEHARREGLVLASSPSIAFHTDPELGLGEFGIETRLASPPGLAVSGEHVREQPEARGRTMIHTASRRPRGEALAAAPPRTALLVLDGRRMVVPAAGAVIGRSRECDIVIDDSAVSRRHAEVSPKSGGWLLTDLESTNGIRVNARRVAGQLALQDGDIIEIGSTEVLFELR